MNDNVASGEKAVVVVDMQKDNVGKYCRDIIPNIKLLLDKAREKGIPVIFACDSRYPDDFLFTRMGLKPYALRGTEGARVIDEFEVSPPDVIIEKRMLSGFFESDLDFTLRNKGIKTIIVTGVSSAGCVFKTVLDAWELGYGVIVPADCCATRSPEDHEWALQFYRRQNMLVPTAEELVAQL
jgi:nicotinamidase-related amidase